MYMLSICLTYLRKKENTKRKKIIKRKGKIKRKKWRKTIVVAF